MSEVVFLLCVLAGALFLLFAQFLADTVDMGDQHGD
jgi:hypothetical protein